MTITFLEGSLIYDTDIRELISNLISAYTSKLNEERCTVYRTNFHNMTCTLDSEYMQELINMTTKEITPELISYIKQTVKFSFNGIKVKFATHDSDNFSIEIGIGIIGIKLFSYRACAKEYEDQVTLKRYKDIMDRFRLFNDHRTVSVYPYRSY